jgi:hypothetical protein
MKGFGSMESWTPDNVEYAWYHGISVLWEGQAPDFP